MPAVTVTSTEIGKGIAFRTEPPPDSNWQIYTFNPAFGRLWVRADGGNMWITEINVGAFDPTDRKQMMIPEGATFEATGASKLTIAHEAGSAGTLAFEMRS